MGPISNLDSTLNFSKQTKAATDRAYSWSLDLKLAYEEWRDPTSTRRPLLMIGTPSMLLHDVGILADVGNKIYRK